KPVQGGFELVEAEPKDFHIQKRFEMSARVGRFGVKWQGQTALPDTDQLGEPLGAPAFQGKAKEAAEERGHFLVALGLGAAIVEQDGLGPTFVLGSQAAFEPVAMTFVIDG